MILSLVYSQENIVLISCFYSRRMISDVRCCFGLLGIVLMIIENELAFNGVDHKNTTFSLLLKSTITFTTILLVGLVFFYHRIDVNLYCVDNSVDDWRIVLTRKKIFMVLLEAFICLIHPIPGHFLVEWSSQYVKKNEVLSNYLNPYRSGQPTSTMSAMMNLTTTMTTTTTTTTTTTIPTTTTFLNNGQPQSYVPIDVMLSIPSKNIIH